MRYFRRIMALFGVLVLVAILGPTRTDIHNYDVVRLNNGDYQIVASLPGRYNTDRGIWFSEQTYGSPYFLGISVYTQAETGRANITISNVTLSMIDGEIEHVIDLSNLSEENQGWSKQPGGFATGTDFHDITLEPQSYRVTAHIEFCGESGCEVLFFDGILQYSHSFYFSSGLMDAMHSV